MLCPAFPCGIIAVMLPFNASGGVGTELVTSRADVPDEVHPGKTASIIKTHKPPAKGWLAVFNAFKLVILAAMS
jgi:hypothetical protein